MHERDIEGLLIYVCGFFAVCAAVDVAGVGRSDVMRLIDAEHFINRFTSLCETDTDIVIAGIVCGALIDEPTAFDIEKVVNELEIERKTANNTYDLFNMNVDLGRVFGLEKAIEIVKCGCVGKDVEE